MANRTVYHDGFEGEVRAEEAVSLIVARGHAAKASGMSAAEDLQRAESRAAADASEEEVKVDKYEGLVLKDCGPTTP